MGLPPIALQAENGLGGAPTMATSAAQPEEQAPTNVSGPATEGPANPGVSVARHIMAALGGSNGAPLDWARGIISGGLAAAANVGKVPEGAGWLAGASRGAAGMQELQRQKMLDAQAHTNRTPAPVATDLVVGPDGRIDACASLLRAGAACVCACGAVPPIASMAPH